MIAIGVGRNSGLTMPTLPASCQSPIASASEIQPAWRPALGIKPAPRKATGRSSALSVGGEPAGSLARSSMLDLALGIDRLFPNQRPQLALQREQFFPRVDVAALAPRERDIHALPNPARPPRQHDDAVRQPHRFFQIMRHIDRA